MKNKSFDDYLQTIHGMQYTGTDDLMPDDFQDWLTELDPLEIIEYAEQWGKTLIKGGEK